MSSSQQLCPPGSLGRLSRRGGVARRPLGGRLAVNAASDAAHQTCSFQLGESTVVLETGRIGRQANGAVLAREGDTALFSTICCDPSTATDGSFLPLTVVYQERFSADGRTASGFVKRDGKQRESEVLVSRLVDRPLRPVFADGFCADTQILQLVLSWGGDRMPDGLAITAAGAALAVSDIPSSKPVAGVRVGWLPGAPEPVVNPTIAQMAESKVCTQPR